MIKKVKIILLLFFLTGCGNTQVNTLSISTSPNIVMASGIEAINAIKIDPDKLTENNEKTNSSESYIKDNKDNIKIEMNKTVETINNCISIPNVCDKSIITIGSTQADVDKYDICLMTKAAAEFGEGKPILLGGHKTKSLNKLYKSKINDIIDVCYGIKNYQYKVIYSNECINDGYKLFDINTGKNMLEYNSAKEILQIYTCYNSNNWLVKAIKI